MLYSRMDLLLQSVEMVSLRVRNRLGTMSYWLWMEGFSFYYSKHCTNVLKGDCTIRKSFHYLSVYHELFDVFSVSLMQMILRA